MKNKEKNTLYTETGCMSSEILIDLGYNDKSVKSQKASGIKSAVLRKKSKG